MKFGRHQITEAPDEILVDGEWYEYTKHEDSYPFFIYDGQTYMGKQEGHRNLLSRQGIEPTKELSKIDFDADGRIWLNVGENNNKNVLSFWEDPKLKLKKVLEKLAEKFQSKYGKSLRFGQGNWFIEDFNDLKPLKNVISTGAALRDFNPEDEKERHTTTPGEKTAGKDRYDYYKALGKKDVEKKRKAQKKKTRKLGYSTDKDYEPSKKIKRFREIVREIIKEMI